MEMINKYRLLALLSASAMMMFASCSSDEPNDEQQKSFVKYLGGPYRNSACNSVQIDNKYFVLGSVGTSANSETMSVFKIDEYGNSLWERNFGNDSVPVSPAMIVKTQSGSVVAIATKHDAESDNIYMVKLNQDGEVEFEKTYSFADNQTAQCIAELDNGNYILGGTSQKSGSGNYQLSMIVDKNGELLREPMPRGSESELIGTLSQLDGSEFVVGVGATMSKTSSSRHWPILLVFSDLQSGVSASIPFSQVEGTLVHFVQMSDDEILACGTTEGKQGLLMSINPKSYALNWYKTYGNGQTVFNALAMVSDGTILLTGSRKTSAGDTDVLVVKVDASGNLLGEKVIGYTDDEVGSSIYESPDNHVVISATYGYENNSVIAVIKDDF